MPNSEPARGVVEAVTMAMAAALKANCTNLRGECYAHGFTCFCRQEGGFSGEVDGEFDLEKLARAAIAAMRTPPTSPGWQDIALNAAEIIVRDVAELPDRSSPDDWPEAMLVTPLELHLIVTRALEAQSPAAPECGR